MWEININNQIITFGLSLCVGAVLCAIYDMLRAWRKVEFNSFMTVFITDIIFWVFSAFVTFIFLMARTNGEIRGYVILGALVGFMLFRISLSRFLLIVLNLLFRCFVKFKNIIFKKIYFVYDKTEGIFLQILRCSFNFLKRVVKSEKNS